MDFMNLNQAAHGDREFGYSDPLLPAQTVAGTPATRRPAGSVVGLAHRLACRQDLRWPLRRQYAHVAVTEGDKVEVQWRLGASSTL